MVNKKQKAKPSKNDDFEITPRIGKAIENKLKGNDKSTKQLAIEIIGESISKLKFRSKKQKEYLQLIASKEISICTGPAGTGKSFLSVYKAIELLLDTSNNFEQIIITTPAVEADEKLGFLPGSIEDKLDPYVFSTFYLIEKLIGKPALDALVEKRVVVVLGFGYMRGINIDKSIVLIEEFQNATVKQAKTLLSRIGEDSKFIISGDLKQSDRFKKVNDTGLYFISEHLKDIEELGFFEFNEEDIVRNPLIGKILKRFEDNEKK